MAVCVSVISVVLLMDPYDMNSCILPVCAIHSYTDLLESQQCLQHSLISKAVSKAHVIHPKARLQNIGRIRRQIPLLHICLC